MRYGYQDKLLRIDLSTGSGFNRAALDEMVDKFLGGRGFVAKMLFDELPRGIDPYDPQNIFVAATGPLSGPFSAGQRQDPFRCQVTGYRRLCGQQHGRPFRPGPEIRRLRRARSYRPDG
jgi:aldehyde:ferredoxin oxidoreductase